MADTTLVALKTGPSTTELREFDLPDCYRALAAKKLHLVELWNAKRQPV